MCIVQKMPVRLMVKLLSPLAAEVASLSRRSDITYSRSESQSFRYDQEQKCAEQNTFHVECEPSRNGLEDGVSEVGLLR